MRGVGKVFVGFQSRGQGPIWMRALSLAHLILEDKKSIKIL